MATTASQVVKFVGHLDYKNEGKFLLEILCQLRNFGVGRYVVKNEWLRRFPNEPSYLKIVYVRPEMDRWLSRGEVYGEWTFRGLNMGLYEFTIETNRSDWKLIHKREEKDLLKKPKSSTLGPFVFPDSFPLPPLTVHMRKEVAKNLGKPWEESQERARLDLCIDKQYEIYRSFIMQQPVKKKGKTIYDEASMDPILGMHGAELPTRIGAWNSGRAEVRGKMHLSKMNELTQNFQERDVTKPMPHENQIPLLSNK